MIQIKDRFKEIIFNCDRPDRKSSTCVDIFCNLARLNIAAFVNKILV